MADGELTPTGDGGSVPSPDPTLRTTEGLLREVAALKELINEKIAGQEKAALLRDRAIYTEFGSFAHDWQAQHKALQDLVKASIEGTTSLRHVEIEKVSQQIDHLVSTTDEKFASVALQFKERDTRSERESRDNKVAVDAAFAAQKEAAAKQEETFSKGIDKSEAATQETINKLAELFRTTNQALADKIDDLKQRLADTESNLRQSLGDVARGVNGVEQRKVGGTDYRTTLFATVAAIAAFLAIASMVYASVKP